MTTTNRLDNRVKALRQARGLTQDELARAAGLSRPGVSAIEAARLIPSVAAALGIARALDCTVEDIFGPHRSDCSAEWAWLPACFPCRYWMAEVAGRMLAYPVESSPRSDLAQDGVAKSPHDVPDQSDIARRTLVLASCDPAAPLLAAAAERRGGVRVLVLTRTSGQAMTMIENDLAHVAGVHLATADEAGGNAAKLAERGGTHEFDLIRLAEWEEGLASQPAARLRSPKAAVREKVRWVGRLAGAGARRHQDELLGTRRPPRHVAADHRAVIEAIRGDWADVGVCLRLVSEEAGLAFLTLGKESYDLCYPRRYAQDPRLIHLVQMIRSTEFRSILRELPGYRPQSHLGEIERVTVARE